MSSLPVYPLQKSDFKFIKLRKVKVADKINTNVINNVAISRYHKSVCVAFANSLKVISIENLLLSTSKDIDDRTHSLAELPFQPSLVSVSGGTNSILLVSGLDPMNCLCGYIYYIPTFITPLHPSKEVSRIDLPPAIIKNVRIQSVAWHPEFSETLFAAILSNGALITFSFDHQTKDLQVLSRYTDSFKLTCVSWSPKGEQLVTGGDNGQLTQFKHQNGKNFEKAKIIQPPKNLESHEVSNVHWSEPDLFKVNFINRVSPYGPNSQLVFMKMKGEFVYDILNYGPVCAETRPYTESNNYRRTFAEIGNILLCLSSHSSEVSVIGRETGDVCPTPNLWRRWILADTARIKLQPDENKAESYPCGVAWYEGKTEVSENSTNDCQNYPMVLILASSGVLQPYYAHFQG